MTALGVLCCFALLVCLTLLASFFLPSHLSFKNMYMCRLSMFSPYMYIQKEPPTKSFVRAVSYVTGFLIRASGEGSVLTYITQSDPKGRLC